ncbi:hypothetical protein XELAEV_18047860mg [Xenopus laevis]|uniref:Uncharacterized protein n=1 Tax=Xenopus laevis TaxID=8355 RepID=A0A974BWI2_XENLA|nr:hypothetical protein XELAEV_18047860mg [Xenopus laevis]
MNCYKKQTITCDAGQDTCVKAYTKISGYDGSPNNMNEYNKYMDIMVWERVCMTKNQCEDYKNKKINTYLKVTCCDTDLCNA